MYRTPFPCEFKFSHGNMSRLKYLSRNLSKDIKFSFDFRDWHWRKESHTYDFFKNNKNWSLTTLYAENGLADAGWAGNNIPSTRIGGRQVPIILTTNFIHVCLTGTIGEMKGSYDEERFLESFSVKLRKLDNVDAVFCSFLNTDGTVCYPLSPLNIEGYFVYPKIKELPDGTKVDLPAALHDGLKLRKIIKIQQSSKYELDDQGYVKVKLL